MNSREVISALQAKGMAVSSTPMLVRVKGSHHHYKHASRPNPVTVPHPKKDLSRGLVKAIEEASGLSIWRK